MKTKELRVGNYVIFGGYETQLISADFTTQCRGLNNSEMPNIEPLPITEKRLTKLGATKQIDGLFKIRDFYANINYRTDICKICIGQVNVEIKYIHTIQNLFFSIYGEELVFSTEP